MRTLSLQNCLGLNKPDRFFQATVTRTKTWVDNEILSATDLNAEFNNVLNALAIVNADISGSAAIAGSKLANPLTGVTMTSPTLNKPTVNASVQGTSSLTPAGGATQDLDLSSKNVFLITMPAGNISLTVSNATAGQFFYVRILQDAGGSRTITAWFDTITWAGASAPTLTTTGSRADLFAFFAKTTTTFDGFTVGTNIG